nr:hypothetical protein [Tanacetum cinerariifolium]
VRGNGENQFRQYVGQNVGNRNRYNTIQNVENQVVQNAVQNLARVEGNATENNGNHIRCYNCRGLGHLARNDTAEGNAIGNNGNHIRCYNYRGLGHLARNCTVRLRRRVVAFLHTQLLIAQKEEAGIQLQAEEFDMIVAAADLDEIKEINVNCILMANLQQASTSGTQTDKAPVYDSDGSAEVHDYDNFYNNEIFNMFTQEEGTVEQHLATVEETYAYFESLYNNLTIEVEKVNKINRKLRETNVDLTTKIARVQNFKIQFLKEVAKFVQDFKSFAKEADEFLAKHKALEVEIERLLRAVINHLENKIYPMTPFPKSKIIPKVVEMNDLSKPVTSNSVPTPTESQVMKNDKVITPGMFMIDPRNTSRNDKFMPLNNVRSSVRTNPITA